VVKKSGLRNRRRHNRHLSAVSDSPREPGIHIAVPYSLTIEQQYLHLRGGRARSTGSGRHHFRHISRDSQHDIHPESAETRDTGGGGRPVSRSRGRSTTGAVTAAHPLYMVCKAASSRYVKYYFDFYFFYVHFLCERAL
jgi:hypothetical protein